MAGRECCRPFESTDDRKAVAWWPDIAGERLKAELLRRGGKMGGEGVARGLVGGPTRVRHRHDERRGEIGRLAL